MDPMDSNDAPPPDDADVDRCIELLRTLTTDRSALAALDPERRQQLMLAAGQLSRPTRHELKGMAKLHRRQRRADRRAHDAQLFAKTELRITQRSSVFVPAPLRLEAGRPETAAPEAELLEPRACYICKTPYRKVHFFYHSMCPTCAQLNYEKRGQTASLAGRVALITGARLKIGYQTALLLLRAGAEVIATTRFPHDAAERYAREPDFASWSARLSIYGIDLRHAPSVELFATHLDATRARLDFLINNAAQTVRRPPAFYAHLVPREEQPLEQLTPEARPLLRANHELRAALGGAHPTDGGQGVMAWHGGSAALGVLSSAWLSQLPCTPEDLQNEPFPLGALDGDLQQVDRRTMNSWRLRLGDVTTPELLEVHLVNAIAPFILNSKLRPLMTRQPARDKHIVNVSAMEAQFARNKKTDKHPHTNMAKAALNMMTRTSAVDYVQDGIFMNSVDTGWVTDEDPLHHVDRKQRDHDFHPPLDSLDGAARVCDPIFTGYLTGEHMWGLFLKDYRPVSW